ncbi:twin-arginine translocation signal domain-containing protein, partial [Pseudomonas syringae]|uniref:twin-arginine translocation signal domain-containing protein n=1 Tax=Pseudomonas syringae TaxID=317 RepID=UPI001F25EAAC
MTISRRGFIAGLALTGAAVPAAYYAHRELTRVEEPVTPGEATAGPADITTQRLADKLRGVWTLRFEGRDAGLTGAPLEGLELFLDIAPRGRGVRIIARMAVHDPQIKFRRIGRLQVANHPEARHSIAAQLLGGVDVAPHTTPTRGNV